MPSIFRPHNDPPGSTLWHLFFGCAIWLSSCCCYCAGPWTTWSQRVLYRCKDATALLKPGANAIGIWLGKGQYDSTWTHAWWPGTKTSGHAAPPLALRLLLKATLTNGTTLTLAASDSTTWTASQSPFLADDVYKGVVFDANLLQDGWARPDFVPSSGGGNKSWTAAVEVQNSIPAARHVSYTGGKLLGKLSPHVYTPTRQVRERFPAKLTEPQKGIYVYWFETNHVGWAQLNDGPGPPGAVKRPYRFP